MDDRRRRLGASLGRPAVPPATSPAARFRPRDLRHEVRRLRDFERWGGAWRGALALVRLGADQALPIVAAVIVAIVTVSGRVAEAALSAALALVLNRVSSSARVRFPWHAAVSSQLHSWEDPNPPTHLEVLLRERDIATAKRALRRAGFNPGLYATHLGTSVPDAPDLDYRIGVQEPVSHPQSCSDSDRLRRIADALEIAAIRARVGGLDILPGAGATGETTDRRREPPQRVCPDDSPPDAIGLRH